MFCSLSVVDNRWATIGVQFEWGARDYAHDLPVRHVPHFLRDLARDLVQLGFHGSKAKDSTHISCSNSRARNGLHLDGSYEFVSDAAIINFYRSGDTLGGHLVSHFATSSFTLLPVA